MNEMGSGQPLNHLLLRHALLLNQPAPIPRHLEKRGSGRKIVAIVPRER
jgi:hypothetical protein